MTSREWPVSPKKSCLTVLLVTFNSFQVCTNHFYYILIHEVSVSLTGPKGKQLEGSECPLHVVHPPTGEEFALGCGVCRNAHTFWTSGSHVSCCPSPLFYLQLQIPASIQSERNVWMSGFEEAVMQHCASKFCLSVNRPCKTQENVKLWRKKKLVTCVHAAVVTLGSLKRCSPPDHWSVRIWKLTLCLILYSILLCWVLYGLAEKTSVQIIYVDCWECYDGRKIVYDLSNLVYNDNIQNRCIQMLLLYTSVLFDILGFVWSQNF